MTGRFDLIAVGRCMVDLYCDQIGSPIAQGQSLSMYIGGCPTNVAVGSRRQGLRVAMLTRVGADATGDFIVATFNREGVDTSHVRRDAESITPMVVAGIEPPAHFPLTWYRERSADLALSTEDYDAAFLGSSQALLVSGNSLSTAASASVLAHLVETARGAGTRIVYDIDYRPMLWQKLNPGQSPAAVADILQSLLPSIDLLVGTEEEYQALMNVASAEEAFEQARYRAGCLAIMKLGKLGARVAPAGAPAQSHTGFPVPVFNTLGAGDAFLSGFLAAWLTGSDLEQSARQANASGALVVTRHGCSPAMPYKAEIDYFLSHAIESPRQNVELNRLHMAGAALPSHAPYLLVLLDDWLDEVDGPPGEKAAFRRLVVSTLAEERPPVGYVTPRDTDPAVRDAMVSGSVQTFETLSTGEYPLAFHGPGGDPGLALRERPRLVGVKTRIEIRHDEPAPIHNHRRSLLKQVQASAAAWDRVWLLDVAVAPGLDATACLADLVADGIRPRYWLLPEPCSWACWQELLGPVGGQVFAGTAPGQDPTLWAGLTVGSETLKPCLQRLLHGDSQSIVTAAIREAITARAVSFR